MAIQSHTQERKSLSLNRETLHRLADEVATTIDGGTASIPPIVCASKIDPNGNFATCVNLSRDNC